MLSRPAPALPTGRAPSPRRPQAISPPLRRLGERARSRAAATTAGDVGVAAAFLTIVALAVTPMVDPDVFWHLATGRRIWATHSVPKVDPFSWTALGRKWIAHEWLTETGLYALHRVGGALLLVAVFAGVIACAFAVAYRTARFLGASRGIGAAVTLLAAVSSVHTWGVRPQMLSLLLTSAVVGVLTRVVRTGATRPLWLLPPVLLVWVNLHGGFVFGVALVALFAGTETVTSWRWTGSRRVAAALWATVAGCVLATLGSPNGIHGLTYPFSYLGDNASTRYIAEWQQPDFTSPGTFPLVALLGLTVLAVAAARPRVGLRELALLAPFGYFAVTSARNAGLFAVVVGPMVAARLTALWEARRRPATDRAGRAARAGVPSPRLLAAALAVASAVVLVPALGRAADPGALRADFPVGTAAHLPAEARGHLLNSYDFGGYLTWYRPGIPVYIDGRPDMYGDAFTEDYMRLTFLRGDWRAELDRRDVRWALLQPTVPLAKALATEPGWRVVARDRASVLYAR